MQKFLTAALLLVTFATAPSTVVAAPQSEAAAKPEFIEGVNYTRLPTKVREKEAVRQLIAQDPNKVQLLFFFSFGCPYCAKFDPAFEKWLSAKHDAKLVVHRFPQTFEDAWPPLAKLYYVMQDLKPSKDLNAEIFQAMHQGKDLGDKVQMQAFFAQHGYSAQDFDAAFNSFGIERQLKFSEDVSKAYGITETPTIVINGAAASYLLTFEQADGDPDKFVQVIDYVLKSVEK